jgi:DNA-binding transcriptional MerR regulator
MLEHPEHGFWREAGVMPRQIITWMNETGMTLDQMDVSLRHCRFAILNREGEEVKDSLSWFWKTIQRIGFYPRPKGFKSLEEQRAEDMLKIVREQAEARKRCQLAELEVEFERLMSNPESEEYKEKFAQLPEFSKNLKGLLLEKSLRAKYFENAGFPLGE